MATDVCIHFRALRSPAEHPKTSHRAYRSPSAMASYLAVREPLSSTAEEILGRFSDARCLLECALRSLNTRDDGGAGVEVVCLRHGLELLRAVYNDLDLSLLMRSPEYGIGPGDSDSSLERKHPPSTDSA